MKTLEEQLRLIKHGVENLLLKKILRRSWQNPLLKINR